MANRAYLRVWTKTFSEETMLPDFARFLTTAPLTESEHKFRQLTIQAVDTTETPLVEWDLKEGVYGPAEIVALAIQQLNADTAYFVDALWDLWNFDMASLKWTYGPQPLQLVCMGKLYDNGEAEHLGHFHADLGFEHLFTGHAGLLAPGAASNPFDSSDHPLEKTFRAWMASSANLKEYHQKTRENIQTLFRWVEAVEAALPVERSILSSEGEQNFEARLHAIVGDH